MFTGPISDKVDDLEAQRTVDVTSSPHTRTSTFLADDHEHAHGHAHERTSQAIDEKDLKDSNRVSSASATTLAHHDNGGGDNAAAQPRQKPVLNEKHDVAKTADIAHVREKGADSERGDDNSARPHAAIEPSSSSSSSSSHHSNDSSPDLPPARDKTNPEYQVEFKGSSDPANPRNWSRTSRWYYTILASLLVFNATFASSSPGGIVEKVMKDLGFGKEVATLMISLFLAGYCVGPLFWGPLSEIYGRRIVFIVSFLFYTGFQVGCALSPNTGAILAFRFLGGCAASSPLANAGALMGDIWDGKTRGKAVALFTLAPFAGPALGPVVGGYIGVSASASWRWLFWVLTIFAGACLALITFTLPETYAPVILKQKAQRLRKETGDERWYATIERQLAETTFGQRVEGIVAKPIKMLFLEPMLLAITIYMSFVYGCLYLLFEAYPIVFEKGHGFNSGEDGLAFLPVFIGGVIGTTITVSIYNPYYVKLVEQHAPKPPPPEARLPLGVIGGVGFAIGFFWFGWTSFPSVSYWAPLMSGLAFGVSLMFLFFSLQTYIIDAYLFEAASALSANTIVRSAFGAGFPLFASQMFDALNPRWASTLLGCVAVVMMPIPVLFIRYGEVLRRRSRYSPTA